MSGPELRFGTYEFDCATMQLRREGRLVHLQAQPKQALAYLLDHAGQVVCREELCRAIWGTETHVDFERGLNFCISQIRTALRDDSANPIYIRTLPKEGYCFIAPVTRSDPAGQAPLTATPEKKQPFHWVAAAAVISLFAAVFAGYWFRTAHAATTQPPVVAVMRFDNETGNPDFARFTQNLTDSVVERLTAAAHDHYAVIGNASILRLPREQRDLVTVAQQLHASYVVLGQVQAHAEQTRVLAHLIRLPDQTHIWVVRLDRPVTNPLAIEAELAQAIASEFAPRIAADQQHPLPQFGRH